VAVVLPAASALQIAACAGEDETTTAGATTTATSATGSGGMGGDGGMGGSGGMGGMAGMGGMGGMGGDPGCIKDSDCVNDPQGNVCDNDTGDCVECLPTKDNCPQGQYCSPATFKCEVGCTDDSDCNPAQNLFCNKMKHTCVGCGSDANCPSGSICISDTCVPGCTDSHPCQPGFTCCSSTCYNFENDEEHCGDCTTNCEPLNNAEPYCVNGTCSLGPCTGIWKDCDGVADNGCEQNTLQDGDCACVPGETQTCYYGAPGTLGIGPCKTGVETCNPDGLGWGPCTGQTLPSSEICGNNIDEDCDSVVDNEYDLDGDGWTTCKGDCCDFGGGCGSPNLVNPGAFEFVGDNVDNDCNPMTSDQVEAFCSPSSKFATVTSDDVAKAMDLCQFTSQNPPLPQKTWGVIGTQQLLANGNVPNMTQLANIQNWQSAILTDYGTGGIIPKKGPTMAGLSSGKMRDQTDPGYVNPNGGTSFASSSQPPAAYLAAHNNKLPSSAGCSGQCNAGSGALDSVNTRLTIRVPTNAQSFSYNFRFASAEYFTFTCQQFNDFYLALLQTGAPGIPTDKNISFDSLGNPVSVNNGFFDVCVPKGCYTCPAGNAALAGTGMQIGNTGGATLWLTTDAPIVPGETMVIEFMVFDVTDDTYDSLVLLDSFTWNAAPATVGTHE
jgi:hypothetical protein